MNLNDQQKIAITHEGGPLLIVAGAGTGKTTVITERIKYLIQTKGIDPQRILAATFTQKAAKEMSDRLAEVMPYGYTEPWLGTFHSLCDRLLKLEGLEIGLNPTYTVMTTPDQWLFIKKHLYELNLTYYRPLGNPNKFITSLITFFSRLQDEDVKPVEFEAWLSKKAQAITTAEDEAELTRLTELSRCYRLYEQLKREESVMDYGDLIVYTLRLFRERPNLLTRYQQHFMEYLVDEFQDTNYAQFELIKLLAPALHNPHLVVVGDDDQSVYKFRGASIANILEFKEHYPLAKEVVLTQNYRSTQMILDCAYNVITHNNPERLEVRLNLQKKLKSVEVTELETPPELREFSTTEQEVEWTAHELMRVMTREKYTYQDVAILTRANAQLEPYTQVLKTYGIPYQLIANRGLFDQMEVKNLLHFLRVLADTSDSLSLFPLTQMPMFALPAHQVFEALAQAKRESSSLWEVLTASPNVVAGNMVDTVLRYQALAGKESVTKVLYEFVLDSGYVNQFMKPESIENQLRIKNLTLFFDKLKQFEQVSSDTSIINFLHTLDLWLEAGEDPGQAQIEDVDTVKLMTVHAAKGLEFPIVFLGGLVAGRFPASGRRDQIEVPEALIKETIPAGNIHLQEERRLFYVALTRAKRYLYLTYSPNVGGVRKRVMSGFAKETGLNVQTNEEIPDNTHLIAAQKAPVARLIQGGTYTITTLSYSQLSTFKKCPMRYKYRYLLQIPARPHHSATYGQTIHHTLEYFHRLEMQGKSLTLEELLAYYEQNYINEGYESKKQRDERFLAGKESLTRYFDIYKEILGKPVMLEQRFKVRFGEVDLIGKIDRVDVNPDGTYEIVDYKTGNPVNQKSADKNDQLSLYAIAAKEALKIQPTYLSLYFIENGGGKITSTRTEKQLETAKQKLQEQIVAMKSSHFPPKPNSITCSFCEYSKMCPFYTK